MRLKLAGIMLALLVVGGITSPLALALLLVPAESISSEFPYPELGTCLNFIIPPCAPLLEALPSTLGGVIKLIGKVMEYPDAIEVVLDRVILRIEEEPSLLVNLVEIVLGGIVRLSILNPLTWPSDPNCQAVIGQCNIADPVGSCQDITYQISQTMSFILRGLPIGGLAYLVDVVPMLIE
jgi:hypothetical protein